MTHSSIGFLKSTARHCIGTGIAIFALMLCLTICLQYGSSASSAPLMPTLSGEEAISYLKEQQLYGPLSEALQGTIANQVKLFAADGTYSDQFGNAVAISGDTLVVGARSDLVGANDLQGSAYVFVRTGAVWSQQAKLTAADGARYDQFGWSVAISGDTLVVGAFHKKVGANTNQGAAYVFQRTGTTWSQQQKLTAADGAESDEFGNAVDISGNIIVVGAPKVKVGGNVAQGSAYVFTRAGAMWSEQQKLTSSDGTSGDLFGFDVAVTGDIIVVSTPYEGNLDQGSAYVFQRTGTVWSQQQKLTAADGAQGDVFGFSVAITGDTLVIGGGNSAYVFVRTGAIWIQQQKLTAADGQPTDLFGWSVAINGNTLVVGARFDDVGGNLDQGSAYVFVRTGTVWSEWHHLTATDGTGGDEFGNAVVISGDTIVVGALYAQVGTQVAHGAAYIFVNTPPTLTPFTPLTANKGGSPKNFVIAKAYDPDQSLDTLPVIAIRMTGSGITLSNLSINAAGQVNAIVQASCDATKSTFMLTVIDSFSATASAPLTINIGPDIEPPQITCSTPITAVAPPACPLSTGKVITYSPPTVIDNCPGTAVACNPPAGSTFPIGTTTVSCTATDAAGNSASCSFVVSVFDLRLQDDNNSANVLLFNSQTGAYRLCANGNTYTGTGVVSKRGCTITLNHNAADRKLLATVDTSLGRGNASMQTPGGAMLCNITDRDIRNDSMLCQ